MTKYFIKKPGGTRKSFDLVAYSRSGRKKVYQPLEAALRAQLDLINSQYRTETVSREQGHVLLKELIQAEYRKHGSGLRSAQLMKINQQVFDRFWEEVYAIKYIDDLDSPRYEILKALRMIEPLSIQTATQGELQKQLRSAGTDKEVRRATGRLNQLLRWLKRDIRLNKPKPSIRQIQYLTLDEFWKVEKFLTPTCKDLAVALIGSGMRLSEALALEPSDYKDGVVSITKQLARKGLKMPKAQKTGQSVVCEWAQESMKNWTRVNDKSIFRYLLYDELIKACQKAFLNNKSKWCSPHDLRHSHAIYLLGQGANLTQVALNLRNRVDVCQMYYTGFSHSEASLNSLQLLLDKKR